MEAQIYQSDLPNNVEYEKIQINVTAAGQKVEFSHSTEIDHVRIIGIAQVFSNENAVPNSTLKLVADGQQIFPDGFESKLIYCGQEVPPDDRFTRYINQEAKQIKVEGTFTDGGSLSQFVPYTANIYLRMLTNRSN